MVVCVCVLCMHCEYVLQACMLVGRECVWCIIWCVGHVQTYVHECVKIEKAKVMSIKNREYHKVPINR